MKLSKALAEIIAEAEVSVFRTFTTLLMSLQKQLSFQYHTKHFLRDTMLTAVDIPAMQTKLLDRTPRSSHQAVNRNINHLCDKPHSAGSSTACTIHEENDDDDKEAIHYSLGKTFGGDARRTPKLPWRGS